MINFCPAAGLALHAPSVAAVRATGWNAKSLSRALCTSPFVERVSSLPPLFFPYCHRHIEITLYNWHLIAAVVTAAI